MMMSYGTFVFSLSTVAYDQLQRQMTWRHARTARVGARPATQFLGVDEDTITLQGSISAELADDLHGLDDLRDLASEGMPQALVEGTGRVYGSYVIEGIKETRKELFADGTPRLIDFQLDLLCVDDATAEVPA